MAYPRCPNSTYAFIQDNSCPTTFTEAIYANYNYDIREGIPFHPDQPENNVARVIEWIGRNFMRPYPATPVQSCYLPRLHALPSTFVLYKAPSFGETLPNNNPANGAGSHGRSFPDLFHPSNVPGDISPHLSGWPGSSDAAGRGFRQSANPNRNVFPDPFEQSHDRGSISSVNATYEPSSGSSVFSYPSTPDGRPVNTYMNPYSHVCFNQTGSQTVNQTFNSFFIPAPNLVSVPTFGPASNQVGNPPDDVPNFYASQSPGLPSEVFVDRAHDPDSNFCADRPRDLIQIPSYSPPFYSASNDPPVSLITPDDFPLNPSPNLTSNAVNPSITPINTYPPNNFFDSTLNPSASFVHDETAIPSTNPAPVEPIDPTFALPSFSTFSQPVNSYPSSDLNQPFNPGFEAPLTLPANASLLLSWPNNETNYCPAHGITKNTHAIFYPAMQNADANLQSSITPETYTLYHGEVLTERDLITIDDINLTESDDLDYNPMLDEEDNLTELEDEDGEDIKEWIESEDEDHDPDCAISKNIIDAFNSYS